MALKIKAHSTDGCKKKKTKKKKKKKKKKTKKKRGISWAAE